MLHEKRYSFVTKLYTLTQYLKGTVISKRDHGNCVITATCTIFKNVVIVLKIIDLWCSNNLFQCQNF